MSDSVQRFYDDFAADYHLIFADWEASMRRQGEALDRLIRHALGPGPLTVLDCSCGIGTQALGLAARGFTVHATDLSPRAVERITREAAARRLPLTAGAADLRTLADQVASEFDVVLSGDNALPHLLTPEDLRQALRGIWTKTRAGGLFLASIRDYDQILSSSELPRFDPPRLFDDPSGRRVTFQLWDWRPDGRTYTLRYFLLREHAGQWSTTHRAAEYRALRRAELGDLLRDAGFADVRWLLPEASGFFQPIVTARKPSGAPDTTDSP